MKVYRPPEKPGRILLYATRRCAVLELSEALWSKICGNGELNENERDTLVKMGVLVYDRGAERAEVLETFVRNNKMKRPFTVLVTLTLECNLSCPYCFEDPFRGRFAMSDETAELLITLLSEKMSVGQDVKIDFYGGEALMALPRLKEIAGGLSAKAPEYGVEFSFSIITNATLLTRKVVEELLPLGLICVRTTLDGPPDIHDMQRPFVSGKGSFDTIVGNIKDIRGLLAIELGGNYTRDNYSRYPEMLDLLMQEGIAPDTFSAVGFFPVFPKADGSVSGDCNSVCAASDEPWMIEAGLYLRGEILKRGFNAPKPRPSGCMVESNSDFVVGYDGRLFKCPAFMGDNELCVGTLANGVTDYRTTHNCDVWKTDECLDCAYLPLCFGGCRFLRRLRTGAIDGVDCRKAIYDATLETIVRQDIELR